MTNPLLQGLRSQIPLFFRAVKAHKFVHFCRSSCSDLYTVTVVPNITVGPFLITLYHEPCRLFQVFF